VRSGSRNLGDLPVVLVQIDRPEASGSSPMLRAHEYGVETRVRGLVFVKRHRPASLRATLEALIKQLLRARAHGCQLRAVSSA